MREFPSIKSLNVKQRVANTVLCIYFNSKMTDIHASKKVMTDSDELSSPLLCSVIVQKIEMPILICVHLHGVYFT